MSVPDPAPHDTAVLIGGPKDGLELTATYVRQGYPICAPHTSWPSLADALLDPPLPLPSYYVAHYDPVRVDGFHSRDDQGRLRYRYAGSH